MHRSTELSAIVVRAAPRLKSDRTQKSMIFQVAFFCLAMRSRSLVIIERRGLLYRIHACILNTFMACSCADSHFLANRLTLSVNELMCGTWKACRTDSEGTRA